MKRTHGFTLTELLITIMIIGVIGTMAVPAFMEMVSSNRLLTSANSFVTTFIRARSEAIKRGNTITISACKPDCGSTGTPDWRNGWQTFAAGTTIAETPALPPNFTAAAHDAVEFATSYIYTAQGRLSISHPNEIMLCDNNRTGETGRLVTLEPIGHVTVSSITCD